jgi:hypothetical protein
MSALYNREDPPNRFQLVPNHMAFANDNDEPAVIYDEETRRNEAILAQWDDFSVESSERSSMDSDVSNSSFENIGCGRTVVVKEEEIAYLPSTIDMEATRRRGKRERPVIKRDVVFCKHCSRGVIRTTEIFYE